MPLVSELADLLWRAYRGRRAEARALQSVPAIDVVSYTEEYNLAFHPTTIPG
jgi:hypothetical protein